MKKSDEVLKDEAKGKSRRNMLKALTAGGAVAAAVPAEWVKPALKGVMLPVHAATTITGDGCDHMEAWYFSNKTCFSMSVTGHLDLGCGDGSGTILVKNSSGATIATCGGVGVGSELDHLFQPSFSCSENGTSNIAVKGATLTVVAQFNNGCSCIEIISAS